MDKFKQKPPGKLHNDPRECRVPGRSSTRASALLLKKLADLGLEQNTLVVFTSDNGGTDGVAGAAPRREGGLLRRRHPRADGRPLAGRHQAGTTCDVPVINVDFYRHVPGRRRGETAGRSTARRREPVAAVPRGNEARARRQSTGISPAISTARAARPRPGVPHATGKRHSQGRLEAAPLPRGMAARWRPGEKLGHQRAVECTTSRTTPARRTTWRSAKGRAGRIARRTARLDQKRPRPAAREFEPHLEPFSRREEGREEIQECRRLVNWLGKGCPEVNVGVRPEDQDARAGDA